MDDKVDMWSQLKSGRPNEAVEDKVQKSFCMVTSVTDVLKAFISHRNC